MTTGDERATILLVDDRPPNLVALEGLLAPLGQRLAKTTSGREALKFLLNEECALILMDVQMPDLDGFETARLIRQRKRTRFTPIIFVTAIHREEEHIIKGYSHGAVDYIVKPVNADALLSKVRVFLEQHQREKRLTRDADLRARERDELHLREQHAWADAEMQRERLRALFMQAPAAIAIVKGPAHVFELANPRYEQLVGEPSLAGRACREALVELAGQGFCDILDCVYLGGEPFLGRERSVRLETHDGAVERFFDFIAQPTRDLQGAVDGVLVHAVDVTESVLARRKLQEADRRKDEFLAMLGHELRNPLAAILTALQLMSLRHNADGADRERAVIERQVSTLSRLVDDLLDVCRATTGKIALHREPLGWRRRWRAPSRSRGLSSTPSIMS